MASGYIILDTILYPKVTIVEKEKIIYRPVKIQIDLEMFYPKNNDVLTLKENESIKLLWNKLDQGATYHLVVKSDEEAPKSFNLDKNEIALNDFKGSEFEWSLSSDSKGLGKKSISGKFRLNREQVVRTPASEPVPEVSFKEKGFKSEQKNIHLKYPEKEINISWHGEKEEPYHFIVTNKKTGRNVCFFEKEWF